MDTTLIFEHRWFFIAACLIIFGGYLVMMDFRRFLAVVCLNLLLQFAWEGISFANSFPYFSLDYLYNWDYEYYVGFIPITAIFLRSLYSTSAYVATSFATRKYIDSKIDLVRDRGKRTSEHVIIGLFAAIIVTVATIAIEPIIVAGNEWAFGSFERFLERPVYLGIDPLFFLGVAGSSAATFVIIATIESKIDIDREDVLFDFEAEMQKPSRYQEFGFISFMLILILPSFVALLFNIGIAASNFLIFIPLIVLLLGLFSLWAGRKDRGMVSKFCDDNPASFVCDMI